ncbi:MAG: DUF2812 domain-containing protein [Oscillospiraceae bacterium]|nr:DUF2812 domain-containing protein [Oscillospiraceae bacterium]
MRRDEVGRWVYCKRIRSDEAVLEIYTDPESKVEVIKRIKRAYFRFSAWAMLIPVVCFGAAFFTAWLLDAPETMRTLLGGGIGGLIGGGSVCIWAWIVLRRKIRRMEADRL